MNRMPTVATPPGRTSARCLRAAAPVLIAAALLASPWSAGAQQALDVLTAVDVFDLEFVSDPQVSPDGSRVVFVRQWSDAQTDRTTRTCGS